MATGNANATAAPRKVTKTGAARKPRAASPFDGAVRVTVSIHSSLTDYNMASPAAILAAYYGKDETVAVRNVQRSRKTRKDGKPVSGPVSQMVYLAPAGFAWPDERTGLRLSQDSRSKLTALAEAAGISLEQLVDKLVAQAAGPAAE